MSLMTKDQVFVWAMSGSEGGRSTTCILLDNISFLVLNHGPLKSCILFPNHQALVGAVGWI